VLLNIEKAFNVVTTSLGDNHSHAKISAENLALMREGAAN